MTFYAVDLANEGGLVMPVVLEVHYADGTQEELASLPRSGARTRPRSASVVTDKTIAIVVLDPHRETAHVLPRQLDRLPVPAEEPSR